MQYWSVCCCEMIYVVFEGPVRSGLWALRSMDRDQDWSYTVLGGYETGLNQLRLRPVCNRFRLVFYREYIYIH
jgi:hypothetical protein